MPASRDDAPRTRPITLDADAEPPDAEGGVAIGERIDGLYTVEGVLGSGGMGTVYLARDEQLDREVAVKLIHGEKLADDILRAAFLREARTMARVHHTNVVTIHALGEHIGRPYFVMERIRGPNLAVWRRAIERPPSLAESLHVLRALCAGVDAIHSSGAVHRDLKPGNVLIEEEGRVAVTDFGLARPIRTAEPTRHAGQLSGTPAYLAPELARDEVVRPALVKQSDLYSLGVIAFEILTGRLPFRAPSLPGMLEQHAHRDPPKPTSLRSDLPPAIDDVLAATLAKDPADRPEGAAELGAALESALGQLERPASPKRILLVDDDVSSLLTLRELLLDDFPEAEVITVTDPTTAATIANQTPPDLVITDLEMPHGGGAGLTRALRRNPTTQTTPIILITGHGGADDWQRLRLLGANRCILKPFDADTLTTAVQSILR